MYQPIKVCEEPNSNETCSTLLKEAFSKLIPVVGTYFHDKIINNLCDTGIPQGTVWELLIEGRRDVVLGALCGPSP